MREPSSEQDVLAWLDDLQAWGRRELPGIARETISYGSSPEQVIDIWQLEGSSPDGMVISLHGGAFSAEYTREIHEALARYVASFGLAVANVEYRRIGSGGGLRETTSDIDEAIELLALREEAAGRRMAVFGHSAGGYLALHAAQRQEIDLVIALAPVADPEGWDRSGMDEGYTAMWMGATAEEDPDLYAEGRLTSPPEKEIVLHHGLEDEMVPHALSVDYHAAALESGATVELLLLEDEGHFGWLDPRLPVGRSMDERISSWARSRSGGELQR